MTSQQAEGFYSVSKDSLQSFILDISEETTHNNTSDIALFLPYNGSLLQFCAQPDDEQLLIYGSLDLIKGVSDLEAFSFQTVDKASGMFMCNHLANIETDVSHKLLFKLDDIEEVACTQTTPSKYFCRPL